jgi:Mrp family chromosome partitioning ATPase/capsular polysaccharide biosynthesis protein
MEILFLWRALVKRWFMLATLPLLAAVVAFFFSSTKTKSYKSFTQVATGFTTTEKLDLNDDKYSVYEADVDFNNLLTIIKSPAVISALAYQLALHDLEGQEEPFRRLDEKDALGVRNLMDANTLPLLHQLLANMQVLDPSKPEHQKLHELLKVYRYDPKTLDAKVVRAYRQGFSDFVLIEAESENPQLSAYIVNQTYEQFHEYDQKMFDDRAKSKISLLEGIVRQKREELDNASFRIRNLQSSSAVVDVGNETSSALKQIQDLEDKIRQAQTRLSADEFEIRAIDRELSGMGQGQATNNRYLELDGQVTQVRRELSLPNLTAARRQALTDSLVDLRAELNRLAGSLENGSSNKKRSQELRDKQRDLQVSIETRQREISGLNQALLQARGSKSVLSGRASDFQKAEQDLKQAQEDFESAKNRLDNAREKREEQGGFGNVKQVIPGQPAVEPESSKRMITTIFAAVGSFVLCLVAILALELLDGTLKTPFAFSKKVKARLLGVVNYAPLNKLSPAVLFGGIDKQSPKPRKKGVPDEETEGVLLSGLPLSLPKLPGARARQAAAFREAIRQIRHEVVTSGKKTFLITSLRAGDGKTTLIEYLAYALGHIGFKVLVVDANFASNRLTQTLRPTTSLEKLVGPAAESESGQTLATATAYPSVDAIGCLGQAAYTPAEALSPGKFRALLQHVSRFYDIVLIEAANMEHHTDARELAAYVDGLICTVAASTSLKHVDKENLAFLQRQGERFSGAILNQVQMENLNY